MSMQWLKLLHVFSIIIWMSGLLLVSRILAAHVKEPIDVQRRMAAIERRLYWGWAFSGMILAWIFGGALLMEHPQLLDPKISGPWFHVKLGFVFVLTVLTLVLQSAMGKLNKDPGTHHGSGRFMAIHGIAGLCLFGVLFAIFVMGGL